jgi:hypothetical protein
MTESRRSREKTSLSSHSNFRVEARTGKSVEMSFGIHITRKRPEKQAGRRRFATDGRCHGSINSRRIVSVRHCLADTQCCQGALPTRPTPTDPTSVRSTPRPESAIRTQDAARASWREDRLEAAEGGEPATSGPRGFACRGIPAVPLEDIPGIQGIW